MTIDADQTRAVDRLEMAMANHARAQRKLEGAELARALAVVDARAAGLTTAEVGALMGVSHVRVVQLSRLAAEGHRGGGGRTARPDPSATGRGAPEPTPVGVLLARALEVPDRVSGTMRYTGAKFEGPVLEDPPADVVEQLVTASPRAEPDPSATGWEAECEEFGCHEQPDPSATVCRRVGCREAAMAGKRFCAGHARS